VPQNHSFILPDDFSTHLKIQNAEKRIQEAIEVAEKLTSAGVPLLPNADHAAIFTDPVYLVAGPLKELGYIAGWDHRCYPSPVDGHDYINVSSGLPSDSLLRAKGWFDYVAVVHPVDAEAREHMVSQGYGNPFIHHITWGITPPKKNTSDNFEYTGKIITYMRVMRKRIGEVIGEAPGTLIIALPKAVIDNPAFNNRLPTWTGDLKKNQYQIETMEGGGFLLQFFVLTGGRIEVALRVETNQTFNPKSVNKISKDELSTAQD